MLRSIRNGLPTALLVTALLFALAACDGGKATPADPSPAAQTVAVEVEPASTTLAQGASAQLAATVTGTAVSTVVWSIVEPGNVGTVSQSGLYVAPTTASGTFHVRARSTVSASAFGDAAVTVAPACTSFTYSAWSACSGGTQTRTVLTSIPSGCMGGASPVLSQSCSVPPPVAVTISPRTTSVDACRTATFTASVANASNQAVTWSVQEAGGGSVSNGVYTAPSTAGTYHLLARSVFDPTAVDTATITVADRVLSVSVSPATTTVAGGGSVQLTATVQTTCGAFTSSTTVAAP